MQLYKAGCRSITLGGIAYSADERGIITIPDDKVSSSVWTQGFVSAHSRIDQLARGNTASEPIAPADPKMQSADLSAPKTETVASAVETPAKPKKA